VQSVAEIVDELAAEDAELFSALGRHVKAAMA
jgi:hypothetical protein